MFLFQDFNREKKSVFDGIFFTLFTHFPMGACTPFSSPFLHKATTDRRSRPRYSLVVDEDVKKPTNQPNKTTTDRRSRPRYNLVVDEDVKKPTSQPTKQDYDRSKIKTLLLVSSTRTTFSFCKIAFSFTAKSGFKESEKMPRKKKKTNQDVSLLVNHNLQIQPEIM